MRLYTLLTLLLLSTAYGPLFAQDNENYLLAQQYMGTAEYDKAQPLLDKEYSRNPSNDVFRTYLNCLENQKDWKDAEKLCRRHIKRNSDEPEFKVLLGMVQLSADKKKEAANTFEITIKMLVPDAQQVQKLAQAFMENKQYDYALKTYEQAGKLFGSDAMFLSESAQVYSAMGDDDKAISYLLDAAGANAKPLDYIEGQMQNMMQKKGITEMAQKELYKRAIKYPDISVYGEMLIWMFVEQRDFEGAFIQAKAIDVRNRESGYRMVNLAQNAANEGFYDAAINCYKYVIENKPKATTAYTDARREILGVLKTKIVFSHTYTNEDLLLLEKSYEAFLNEFGHGGVNIAVIRDYASLEALYLHNITKALDILKAVMDATNVPRKWQGMCKLDYGDYQLLNGNTWDALLTYGQVEKDFKADELGEEARFKSAKLSYYDGDFDWANTQLKIIKGSTTELISNDAINLSVFIMEKSGLDSVPAPLRIFARADLLFYQNKFDEAKKTYDSIPKLFPEHDLNSDVILQKSRIKLKEGKYTEAADLLATIENNYKFDVLADEALFELADLYEHQLNNKTKAEELYQLLLTEYKGSVYSIEARKRFRKLRGDILE